MKTKILKAKPKRTYKEKKTAKEFLKKGYSVLVVSDVIEEFALIHDMVVAYRPIEYSEDYLNNRIKFLEQNF